jgi:hypothetical protein
MLQGSMREVIEQGGFVELRGTPRLVEAVGGDVTEVGIRLRLPDIVRGGAP